MKFHVSYKVTMFFAEMMMIFSPVRMRSMLTPHSYTDPKSTINFARPPIGNSPSATGSSFLLRFSKDQAFLRSNEWIRASDEPTHEYDATSSNLHSTSNPHVKPDDSQNISPASLKLNALLSPDTFSKADPFQYLIRETSKLLSSEMVDLRRELDSRLKTNGIPESSMPYARALRSIILVQLSMLDAKLYFEILGKHRDLSNTPPELSSPSPLFASGLFSPEIFSKPDFPIPILDKLIRYSKNDILNLTRQLKDFLEITREWRNVPGVWWQYMRYVEGLLTFLRQSFILDDFKRNMDETHRLSISAQNFTNARLNN